MNTVYYRNMNWPLPFLQQEMRLASAQKAARRADTLIVAIPLTFALIMNNTFLLIAILFYCRVFPPGYAWTAIPISCIGAGTGILAARPTNTVSVRSIAVFTIPADCIPVLVLNCGFMVFAAIYEPWRPAARPVRRDLADIARRHAAERVLGLRRHLTRHA